MYVRPYPPKIPPVEHIPFSTTIILCDPPRIYPSLPESTPLFQSIDVCDNNYMRPSHPSFPEYIPFSTNVCATIAESTPLPEYTPPFQQLHATLPESTPPSQNIPPFQQL